MGDLNEIVTSKGKLAGINLSMERFRKLSEFKFKLNVMDIPFIGIILYGERKKAVMIIY